MSDRGRPNFGTIRRWTTPAIAVRELVGSVDDARLACEAALAALDLAEQAGASGQSIVTLRTMVAGIARRHRA